MRKFLWVVPIAALLLFAVDAQAGCSVCIPNCADAAQGVTGRVNCMSSSSYCTIWGTLCDGGSSCECGTMGCNPCNATCAPEAPPAQWQLVRVNVETPRTTPAEEPSVQWTLVAVRTKRTQS